MKVFKFYFISQDLRNTIEKASMLTGLSLIEPLKWSFMKCWAYTFMCIYQLITFYSWINSWHDTLYIVKTAVVYGIAFQVTIRLYIYVTRANSLNGLKLYTDELYKAIENSDLKRMMLMVNTIRKAKTAFKVLLSFYVFSSALFLVNPIYELVINKRRTTIFPYKMPYINTNSYYGYLFTLIVELLLDGYLAFGLAGFDGTFIFYAMQTIGLVGLIKVDMDEFRDLLVMKCLTEKEIRKRLRRIINIHKELNAFIDMLKRFFIIQTFAIVTSSVISVCMCLISIVFSKWYAAFGFIIAALFQLFITCMLGTMIEIQVSEISMTF